MLCDLFFVFFCGIIGVSGMTLPGLSGSFILILLGNYVLLLVDSVNALYETFSDILRNDYNFLEDAKTFERVTNPVIDPKENTDKTFNK